MKMPAGSVAAAGASGLKCSDQSMALLGWPVLLASDTGKQGRHLTEDWNTAIKVTRRVPNTQTQFSTLQFVANLYCCAHFGQLVSCISQVAESSLIFMADDD